MASFALASKPVSCPDQPDSPVLNARQEIVSKKRGVCFSGFASHEWSPQTPVKVNSMVRRIVCFKPGESFRINARTRNSENNSKRRDARTRVVALLRFGTAEVFSI